MQFTPKTPPKPEKEAAGEDESLARTPSGNAHEEMLAAEESEGLMLPSDELVERRVAAEELTKKIEKTPSNVSTSALLQGDQLSQGGEAIKRKLHQKQRQRAEQMLKHMKKIEFFSKNLEGGGRIDENGYVYDAADHWIITIDKSTGDVINRYTGEVIGTYVAKSSYSEYRLCELISNLDTRQNSGWYAGSTQDNNDARKSAQWGGEGDSTGKAAIWGQLDTQVNASQHQQKDNWW